jgi:hypothetical protein
MKSAWPLFLIAAACIAGCTDLQLQTNTVRESLTVIEIEQQQVLDNLARFCCNYNSIPSFSYPNLGSAIVTDSGTAGLGPTWSRVVQGPTAGQFLFTALGLSLTGSRQAQESFTLTPINDPRKLELMRCAYQRAVSSCGYGPPESASAMSATFDPSGHGGSKESQRCPDCESVFNKFYTGDPNGVISDSAHGITTSDCLKSDFCWFHSGPKKCVPKHCVSVGHYCDLYVWVLPEGQDQLTRLTLAILDYAQNSAPIGLNKTVVFWVDEYGIPTEQKLAVGSVTATVGIDELPASLLNTTNAEEGRLVQTISARLKVVSDRMAELLPKIDKTNAEEAQRLAEPGAAKPSGGGGQAGKNDPNFEEYKNLLTEKQTLQDKLVYLREQLRTPGLKQRYMSLGPSISPGSSLLPFNLIQGATVPQGPAPGANFAE